MHESGVHATVAGVLLAFTVPVVRSDAAGGPDAGPGLAEHFEHRIRPLSAGVAVPVFAFFSAGVAVGGLSGLGASLGDSIAIGIMVGLVAGKAIGISAATWLVSRFTRAQLDENLGWPDVLGLALLGGMGFTVSLLITELAYGAESESYDHAKVGILGRHAHRGRCWPRWSCGCATAGTADRGGGDARRRPRRHPRRLGPRRRPCAAAVRRQADNSGCRAAFGGRTVVVHERGGGP